MDLAKLGYTKKWIEYDFLDEKQISTQIALFEKVKDQNAGDYRSQSFRNWLKEKESFTNQDVYNYINLALADKDEAIAGSAITMLFVSSKLTDEQFGIIKGKLPEFGKWTKKLITREVLTRRINNEEMTLELFKLSYDYKLEFKDNRLLINIIKSTNSIELLSLFSELEIGKKIKTLANNKMNKLQKVSNKT